jgi:hypothetical protein
MRLFWNLGEMFTNFTLDASTARLDLVVMLLLAAAIAIRRTPWPAHGPDSVLLYAEDEAGMKLGHAAVEVSASTAPQSRACPVRVRLALTLTLTLTRSAGSTAAPSRAYPRPCSARCSPRYSSTRTNADAVWPVS